MELSPSWRKSDPKGPQHDIRKESEGFRVPIVIESENGRRLEIIGGCFEIIIYLLYKLWYNAIYINVKIWLTYLIIPSWFVVALSIFLCNNVVFKEEYDVHNYLWQSFFRIIEVSVNLFVKEFVIIYKGIDFIFSCYYLCFIYWPNCYAQNILLCMWLIFTWLNYFQVKALRY